MPITKDEVTRRITFEPGDKNLFDDEPLRVEREREGDGGTSIIVWYGDKILFSLEGPKASAQAVVLGELLEDAGSHSCMVAPSK